MMKFGDFTFPVRPEKVEVKLGRILHKVLPDGELITDVSVRDLGEAPRVAVGEGTFYGSDASVKFSALAQKMNTAALLVVPGVGQWQAYLSELTYLGKSGTDDVGYAFRFDQAVSS